MNSDCDNIKDRIADLISGILSETQVHALEQHLDKCAACRDYARALKHEDVLLAEFFAKIDTNMTGRQERVLQVINNSCVSEQTDTISIWRTIMKRPITKIAAAAVIIIIAVLIGINHFGGSVDMTSVAWGQMIESMKQLPWMHIIMESDRGEGKQRFEVWVSFESRVGASRRSSGEATYSDGQKHILYRYDPAEQSITVSYSDDDITKGATSVWNFWETWLKQVAELSTEFTEETGRYNGRKAKIYKLKASKNETTYASMIIVDIERNLPVFGHQKSFDSSGNLIKAKDLYFEYPEEGPASIYDVGVPKSAKVINKLTK